MTPRTQEALAKHKTIDGLPNLNWVEAADMQQVEVALEEWLNAAKHVDNRYHDEAHCGCVPILRKQLDDSRKRLRDAYERFRHLDGLLEAIRDDDGTDDSDPFHAATRDLWRAIKASLGHDANTMLTVSGERQKGQTT